MRVLFDVTHPVHVHFFQGLAARFQVQGHEVMVTARDKDVTLRLLQELHIPFRSLGRERRGFWGKGRELLARNMRLLACARQFKPDVMVAEVGVSIGPVGAILGVPRVVFDQVDRALLQQLLGWPFASVLCLGLGCRAPQWFKPVRLNGFLAQSYLDPSVFQPDQEALRASGVDPSEPYSVVRLVGRAATHDLGWHPASRERVTSLIRFLEQHGRVLISSEQPLPEDLRKHAPSLSPRRLHDLLACASLCVAEGGTVAVEAALLGTPAVCCGPYRFGYLDVLEQRFQLIRRTPSLDAALSCVHEWVRHPDIKRQWREKADSLWRQTDCIPDAMYRLILQAAARTSP